MPGYRVLLWPDDYYSDNWPDTQVGKKMRRLARDHSIAFQQFDNDMILVQDPDVGQKTFDERQGQRIFKNLGKVCGSSWPSLWEFRRPKRSRSGVMRIYGVVLKRRIVILDGEFKVEKAANYETACSRLREGRI